MAKTAFQPDTQTPYKKRAGKRRRTIGIATAERLSNNVIDEMIESRTRKGRKQYRWTDLKGTDRIEMLRMVRDCSMAAMTTFEIAEYFGVNEFTLNEWVSKDPEFAIAMRLPRELADERVEKALYHRAVGYRYRAEEIKITEAGDVHRVPVIKQIPPDITAATFWLKNRKGDTWREKQDVNLNVDGSIEVTDKSEDPRQLAMAVLDVLQQAIYDKLPVTIDDRPVVAKKHQADYDLDLENMSPDEIAAQFEADPDEDR